MNTEIATPVEGISLAKLVSDIELSGEKNGTKFELKHENYLRSLISSKVKFLFPDRIYKVSKKTDHILVWRKP